MDTRTLQKRGRGATNRSDALRERAGEKGVLTKKGGPQERFRGCT